MQTVDRALLAVGAATALLLIMTIIATAGEQRRVEESLADVVARQERYWASVQAESDRRRLLDLEERQTRALEAIAEGE
jgi:hypothetical protein